MNLEAELHQEMLDLYQRAGAEVGYWGRRYLQAVRRHGGLARARAMLKPASRGNQTGLDALIAAGRPDLSLEALVLQPRFALLFTDNELAEARHRLGRIEDESRKVQATRERLFPDELEPGRRYPEGARKQVRVNAYERNRAARMACVRAHGCQCAVCGFDFEARYGAIGKSFVHVHHLTPLPDTSLGYLVDPVKDLIPVCPNCHAMLHRKDPPFSVAEVRERMGNAGG